MTNTAPTRSTSVIGTGPLIVALAAPFVALLVLNVVPSPRVATSLAIAVMTVGFAVVAPSLRGLARKVLTGICVAMVLIAGVVLAAGS